MKNETRKTIQESKKWNASEIENMTDILSNETKYTLNIGKKHEITNETPATQYFTSLGINLYNFPKKLK